jgi:hypothetical protein
MPIDPIDPHFLDAGYVLTVSVTSGDVQVYDVTDGGPPEFESFTVIAESAQSIGPFSSDRDIEILFNVGDVYKVASDPPS